MISDCSGKISALFFSDGDGNMIPFTGIKKVEITDNRVERYDFPHYSLIEPAECSFSLTKKSAKRLKKIVKADINRWKRNVRR